MAEQTPSAEFDSLVLEVADALLDQMSLGTSGRYIVDFGTTPEHLAEDVLTLLAGRAIPPGASS